MSVPAVPLSGVVTTFDNARTLARCLDSLVFCDEIVVLDSGSTDGSVEIARGRGCRIQTQPFAGYGPQKQAAIDLATHDWVLLLDADEFIQADAADAIRRELATARADGYRLERQEWLFWRWPHPGTRGNRQLRLFRRSRGAMNQVPVHAAPEVRGAVIDLPVRFFHDGEPDIATRVDKINRYSSGLVPHTRAKARRFTALRVIVYPYVAFAKLYVGKRYFLNGWAGFIAARTQAFYAFLKYAKLLEAQRANTSGQ